VYKGAVSRAQIHLDKYDLELLERAARRGDSGGRRRRLGFEADPLTTNVRHLPMIEGLEPPC